MDRRNGAQLINISKSLALPLDAVTSTLVVYGGKGMGKTNFGSVLVEEMTKKHLRWAVLDPLGVWWGLRHSADGQGPGIECLIVGGESGEGHRPMPMFAFNELCTQVIGAGVPLFVKQDSGRYPGAQGRISAKWWGYKQFPEVGGQ